MTAPIFLMAIGLAWSFVCYMAMAAHPTPSQAKISAIMYFGPVVFIIGSIWIALVIAAGMS